MPGGCAACAMRSMNSNLLRSVLCCSWGRSSRSVFMNLVLRSGSCYCGTMPVQRTCADGHMAACLTGTLLLPFAWQVHPPHLRMQQHQQLCASRPAVTPPVAYLLYAPGTSWRVKVTTPPGVESAAAKSKGTAKQQAAAAAAAAAGVSVCLQSEVVDTDEGTFVKVRAGDGGVRGHGVEPRAS